MRGRGCGIAPLSGEPLLSDYTIPVLAVRGLLLLSYHAPLTFRLFVLRLCVVRTVCVMGRASKDKRDIYYRKAKEEGYRARSAYKLLQIHEEFDILSTEEITTGAVDLCAAPGSWSQVLSAHMGRIQMERKTGVKPRIVAVDLQEMAPIDGVTILQGDITSEATAREIIRLLNAPEGTAEGEAISSAAGNYPRKADIVVCDGAPDVTGMHELDEYLQHHLLLAALNITTFVLRSGGCFVTKLFRGPNTPFLVAKSEIFFEQVRVVKPKSSRNASMECFLLCQGFRMPPGYLPCFPGLTARCGSGTGDSVEQARPQEPVTNCAAEVSRHGDTGGSDGALPLPRTVAPFLSCGDLCGFDADMCYDREAGAAVLAPVRPPITRRRV